MTQTNTSNKAFRHQLTKARLLRWAGSAAAFGAGCLWCLSAAAADDAAPKSGAQSSPFVTESIVQSSSLRVLVHKSITLDTKSPYKRVNVSQPEVADVNVLGPGKLLITGKKAGGTQVMLWDDQEKAQVIDVIVQVDVSALADEIKRLFPGVKVEVLANNADVVLKGNVPSLEIASQITELAKPYGASTLNFLEVSGGQQVQLQVRVAEVSRAASTALGVNFGVTDSKSFAASNVGGVNPFGTKDLGSAFQGITSATPGAAVTFFGQGLVGKAAFQYFIDALRQNNLLRILAEPNLIAVSGQEASFLAGGSIPIPVSQGGQGNGAAISVDYREYGVKLKFIPIVLGDGRIRLKVSPEVSDLDYANSVTAGGFKIPGMTSRKVTTTIELADGQTFAIAGLLNTSTAASKDVTPLLGDIPVIGALFRTVRYSRKETEMVVLVTPHLVEPLNPADVQRMPGEEWRFPNEMDLFINQDLGGERNLHKSTSAAEKSRKAPTYHGDYGFVPARSPKETPAAPVANVPKD